MQKLNMVQENFGWDQSHEQTVGTGRTEKGCFLSKQERTVRVRKAMKKKLK
jgi:hypothetical protein